MGKKVVQGGVIVGNLLFTSGMTGQPGDVETQIRNTLSKLKAVLTSAGTSFENVVKATVYLTDIADRERYLNKVWAETFPRDPPARTTVQVGLGPGTFVEIEMVAVIPEK
ncbi:MAG: RidA family protein [Candidatus Bathyarchaeia archaeon]